MALVSRRGIYLLPNLFTTGTLFSGFFSIVQSMQGHFELAALVIFIAMLTDALDGRIARLTHTESDFGVQYDSLADVVAFGVAPAILVFSWKLHSLGTFGWICTFLFAAGTALRLARFNTQVDQADKHFFQGLPCPSAAGALSGMVWVLWDNSSAIDTPLSVSLSVALALLMVSNIRYRSFKELQFRGRVPFFSLLVGVLLYTLIALDPPLVLWSAFLLFAALGPFETMLGLRKTKKLRLLKRKQTE